ncbi:TetR/AcrR family transcriptional regulator [Actinokineospora iranica]|uniref:DNA-binding transcriptional regulator, AcrR family n=1 Tax=Actinokineospora iranica TaxID=1271860 RepID=A0A1G6LFU6_9PSEU|nr:TetR/AcrR family transcriptional regulator [Actinokineospora iranica]SDC41827.1 DNA-binding transcriptional regulator, AcrR family [Actinokineospora iranica]
MARLSRAEAQTRNREALLRTARDLFLRDGYHATSIARIAEETGVTTGAVYSNFDGKAQLALLVLRDIQRERIGELRDVIGGAGAIADGLDRLHDWTSRAMASGWPRLELEFALDARGEARLVAAEADRQRSVVDSLAAAIETRLADHGVTPGVPVRTLVESAVNLAVGLATRHVIDPRVTADNLVDLIRGLLPLVSR